MSELQDKRAKAIASAKQRLKDEQSVVLRSKEASNVPLGIFNSVRDGITFGFTDELASIQDCIKAAITTPGSISDRIDTF